MAVLSVCICIFASTILCGLIAVFAYHARRFRLYKLASALPGPPTIPLLGNALEFSGTAEDVLRRVISLANSYPEICRLWLGPNLVVATSNPDVIKTMMIDHKMIEKILTRKFFESWLGAGLIMTPAKDWHGRRRLVASTFNSIVLQSFVATFATQAEIMLRKMEVHENGGEFDLQSYVSLCTFDMICETTMGVEVGAQTASDCKYKMATDALMSISTKRFMSPWLYPDVIFHLTKYGAQEAESVTVLKEYAETVIRKKKQAMPVTRGNSVDRIDRKDDVQIGAGKRKSLLDILLEWTNDDEKLSDEDLVFEINTVLVAGFDTTSMGSCFTLLMLASNPDVQEKVYLELREIYGDDDRPVVFEDLKMMVYLERAIKETLRLFPVVPFMSREVTEDIKIGDHVVPKRSTFFVCIMALQRNPKLWPDPFKFDPDRFLPEEIEQRHPYAYIPFGAGARNCVGARYAMLAMKVICATILRKYTLKKEHVVSIGDIGVKAGIAAKPSKTITMSIEKRR